MLNLINYSANHRFRFLTVKHERALCERTYVGVCKGTTGSPHTKLVKLGRASNYLYTFQKRWQNLNLNEFLLHHVRFSHIFICIWACGVHSGAFHTDPTILCDSSLSLEWDTRAKFTQTFITYLRLIFWIIHLGSSSSFAIFFYSDFALIYSDVIWFHLFLNASLLTVQIKKIAEYFSEVFRKCLNLHYLMFHKTDIIFHKILRWNVCG